MLLVLSADATSSYFAHSLKNIWVRICVQEELQWAGTSCAKDLISKKTKVFFGYIFCNQRLHMSNNKTLWLLSVSLLHASWVVVPVRSLFLILHTLTLETSVRGRLVVGAAQVSFHASVCCLRVLFWLIYSRGVNLFGFKAAVSLFVSRSF